MRKRNIVIIAVSLMLSTGVVFNKVNSQTASTVITKPTVNTYSVQYQKVNALDIVANPYRFLNRYIKISAKFDKFSTLGLDYPNAMRSSEKYISFLIQRPDVHNHNIPLSELKIFLKKEVAEKNIDLDAGDEIEFTGKVFSTALGDAWIDVNDLKVITKKNPPKKEENSFE
jgi:hypothetical protein